jgi:hypothetical protein
MLILSLPITSVVPVPTLLPLTGDTFGGSVTGVNAANATDGDTATYANVTSIPNWSGEATIGNRIVWQADLGSDLLVTIFDIRHQYNYYSFAGYQFLPIYRTDAGSWTQYGSTELTGANNTPIDTQIATEVTARYVGVAAKQTNYGGSGSDFRLFEFEVTGFA